MNNKIISFCAGLFFAFASTAWAAPANTPAEKIKQLKVEMQKLTKSLASDRKEHAGIQEELRQQELATAKITKKIQELDQKIALEEQELKEQEAKENKLNNEIGERQEHLAESIRALHATGQQPDIKLLLNQDNTLEFQRLLTYYQLFNQALAQQIIDLDEDLGKQAQLREKIAAAKDELTAERAQQQEQQQQLKAQQKERNVLLASLEKEISSKDKQVKELAASEKELQRVLAAAQSIQGNNAAPVNVGPFSKQQGKLPWPTNGKVQHSFGSYRSGGQRRYDGIIISAPEGQPVQAVYPGRVVYADWLRGFGLLVIIDHGNKYMSLYAHNDTLYTRLGEMVKAGQQVSTVGTTGGLRKPGLYFEIRQNGKPVNPQKWLRPRK